MHRLIKRGDIENTITHDRILNVLIYVVPSNIIIYIGENGPVIMVELHAETVQSDVDPSAEFFIKFGWPKHFYG